MLDQGVLRDRNGIAAALDRCRREDLQLLIPDIAAFEWSLAADPLETWRKSLELLSSCPGFVSVSGRLSDMLNKERASGQPCTEIVHDGATERFRAMLTELGSGDETLLRGVIAGPVQTLVPVSAERWSNHDEIKGQVDFFGRVIAATFDGGVLSGLRQNPTTALRQWLCSTDGLKWVFNGIKQSVPDERSALWLAAKPSVSAVFVSAIVALAMYWRIFGGIDAAPAKTFTADLKDLEYAVVGSLSRDMVTKDKRLAIIHRAMAEAVKFRHRWVASQLGCVNNL